MTDYAQLLEMPPQEQQEALRQANGQLTGKSPQERVAWALEHLPQEPMLSSSFGIQAALMLHLMTQQKQDIPVVLTDTGYLFPETYRFADELTQRFGLNLHVYRPAFSAAWAEARHGKMWLEGEKGMKRFNQMHKVEPMQRALRELRVGTWFSGLRRSQSATRQHKPTVEVSRGTVKVYPVIDWSNRDLHQYMVAHDLPYHPLWDQGYVSVGDVHSTRPLEPGMTEEQTRFLGLGRECGLHLDGDGI